VAGFLMATLQHPTPFFGQSPETPQTPLDTPPAREC